MVHHFMAERWEKVGKVTDFIFLGFKIIVNGDLSHAIKRRLHLGRKAMTSLDIILIIQDFTLMTKFHIVKATVFPVVTFGCWELDVKEGWELKNWCFLTVVLEKTLESPLDNREVKPVHTKGNQHLISLEELTLKLQYFGHLDMKNWLIAKDPDAGKDQGKK